MPANDRYYEAVKNALLRDGWQITNDPLTLQYEGRDLYVDLAAERFIAAQQGTRKIAVEIKTFAGRSEMADLHQAIGQYIVYTKVLNRLEPEREVYLAISDAVYQAVFTTSVGALLIETQTARLFTFDPEREVILQWIPLPY